MKFIILIGTIIFGLLIYLAFFLPDEEENGVLIFRDNNFDTLIEKYDRVLLDFYADWCTHCKIIAPDLEQAAIKLRKEKTPLYIAKIDCESEKLLGRKFKIEQYPTFIYYEKGQKTKYDGGLSAIDFTNWMKKRNSPTVSQIIKFEDISELLQLNDLVIILIGNDQEKYEKYHSFAEKTKTSLFWQCKGDFCKTKLGLLDGQIALYRSFDKSKKVFKDEFNDKAFEEFIQDNSIPLYSDFDSRVSDFLFKKNNAGIVLYRDPNKEGSKELDILMEKISQDYKDELQFVKAGATGQSKMLADYNKVLEKDYPAIRIHDYKLKDMTRNYKLDGKIHEASIREFIENWKDDKLKRVLKSQAPKLIQKDDAYQMVSSEFKKLVLESPKDVIVEFYSENCPHCKELAPIYEEFAKKMKNRKNFLVAKMDAVNNEVDDVSIKSYPIIYLWPADKKDSPIEFNEARTADGFIHFLEAHATNYLNEDEKTTKNTKNEDFELKHERDEI